MTFSNKIPNSKKTYKYNKNHTSSEEDNCQDGASKNYLTRRDDNQEEQKLKMLTQI